MVNVAFLCNLCLLSKYLQAIVSWFWETWSFHVIVWRILSLHYSMWKVSGRQSISCHSYCVPQRLTCLCFVEILTRCAFMLSLCTKRKEIYFVCYYFLCYFLARFSRHQVYKEQIVMRDKFFLSAAEHFILLNALFRYLCRCFVFQHPAFRSQEGEQPQKSTPVTHFPSVTA